MNNGVVFVPPP